MEFSSSIARTGKRSRYRSAIAVLSIGVLVLSACTGGSRVPRGLPGSNVTPDTGVEQLLTSDPKGEVIGTGSVRVALLVPSSIPGGAASVAKELRNGAALAMQDFGMTRLQLVVKDTKGQASEAQFKATEAIQEGSSLVLGPLFAANVSAASGITLPANVTMMAFSTDTSIARRGVYLFSYTPQADTRRIIAYAGSLGRRSMMAFLPNNAEGSLREKVLREMTGSNGIELNIIKYDRTPESIETIVATNVEALETVDSIYVPEGGPIPNLILSGLQRNGANFSQKQIFGSGNWESVNTKDPLVAGAYYPGRDISKFNDFSNRYQTKFGTVPGVQAAIAYDALTLAAELVRANGDGKSAYTTRNLENPNGFQGVNGAFRLRSNGTSERGLAIYQIQSGTGVLAEPAVSRFSRLRS